MKCFERFFKAVNCREGKLVAKRRAYMMDDLELIGLDYLWRVSVKKLINVIKLSEHTVKPGVQRTGLPWEAFELKLLLSLL